MRSRVKPKVQYSPARRVAEFHRKGKLPLLIRGRWFTLRDLRIILSCVAEHSEKGRTFVSQEVCRQLDWRQPNGWLKERACRDVLRYLARRRLVQLPEKLVKTRRHTQRPRKLHRKQAVGLDLKTAITYPIETIVLELSKGNGRETLWNYLVDRYHYLGHRSSVGRCLKYLVWGDERLVGAISFSSPAWRLESRDLILTEIGWTTEEIHSMVINNNRFLILPHVRVDHLASQILSLATQAVIRDWKAYYSVKPRIAETFVSPRRFEGTCYRAANWLSIGCTRGYRKRGSHHQNSQRPKEVFLYGLSRHLRMALARQLSPPS
jgi:Domain of unknown function (DUF4338)